MRKILLASAAILGATGGIASAQTVPNPSQGQLAAPWASGPAANNNNNARGRAAPGNNAIPTPGTVVIRLNGRVKSDVSISSGTGETTPGFKVSPINFFSYMRLYPGVDGMAANGLRYGASIELRENFPAATVPASSASTFSSGQTVFVRRAFTYMGTDQVGIVRLGVADGVIGLFDNGTFSSQTWDAGIGNFNGGAGQLSSANVGGAIPFVWLSQTGQEYDNAKVVYLTPQFFGFDFGVQYAPNMGSANAVAGCPVANAACHQLTAGTDASRWLNQVAAGVRYQGSFGGVDIKAFGVYETAGKESIAGGGFVANGNLAAQSAAGTTGLKYDNLSFFNAGAAVSFAGFTVAADYIGGALNGALAMRPQGGAPMNALVTGITYANGPWVFGLETAWVESQGDVRLTKISQRHEWEIGLGGQYKVAPGLTLAAEYIYGQRHQGGFDFVANNPTGTRDVHAQSLVFSTIVTW